LQQADQPLLRLGQHRLLVEAGDDKGRGDHYVPFTLTGVRGAQKTPTV
jgi:hypothetical protein